MRLITNDTQVVIALCIGLFSALGVYVIALMYGIPWLTQSRLRRIFAMVAILAAGAFLGIAIGTVGIVVDIAFLGATGNPTTILVGCISVVGLVSTFVVAIKRAPLPHEQFKKRGL